MKTSFYLYILLAIGILIGMVSSVCGQDYAQQALSKDRDTAYAQWQGAHPNVEMQLTDLKKKTAELVRKSGQEALPANRDKESKPIIWKVEDSLTELWDHPDAPFLAIIPAGAFVRGQDPNADRDPEPEMKGGYTAVAPPPASANTDNRYPITITYPFALGKYDVTRAEFERFVLETGYQTNGYCSVRVGENWVLDETKNWHDPGFEQGPNDPVVCVSWNDGVAYAAWISGKTGKKYRLPSAAEYEYAAAGGTSGTTFWFGSRASHDFMNYGSDDLCQGGACTPLAKGKDKWKYTSPVGSFQANPFGLYDMNGNVRQWVADCAGSESKTPPTDGSPDTEGCSKRLQRSGSWNSVASHGFPWGGHTESPDYRSSSLGFRLARTLD